MMNSVEVLQEEFDIAHFGSPLAGGSFSNSRGRPDLHQVSAQIHTNDLPDLEARGGPHG